MEEKIFELVDEQNGSPKCLATTFFSAAMGPIRGGGDCGTYVATGSGNSSTLGISQKWYIPHSPLMAHIWLTFFEKEGTRQEGTMQARLRHESTVLQ